MSSTTLGNNRREFSTAAFFKLGFCTLQARSLENRMLEIMKMSCFSATIGSFHLFFHFFFNFIFHFIFHFFFTFFSLFFSPYYCCFTIFCDALFPLMAIAPLGSFFYTRNYFQESQDFELMPASMRAAGVAVVVAHLVIGLFIYMAWQEDAKEGKKD